MHIDGVMTKYQLGAFPHVCSCGKSYDVIAWPALPLVGIQSGIESESGQRFYADLEMRNCSCGSTITAPLE